MSESHDYEPASWARGHDFGPARAAYQKHVSSSMGEATRSSVSAREVLEPRISTKARRPLIIVVDETSSMGEWPSIIFSKLPYLVHEAKDYLGDDNEIAFMAIGDATNGETYPLQARPFASDEVLLKHLKELIHEAKGGGNDGETYELAALYLSRNMDVSQLSEPIIVFIGDEPFFDTIAPADAKLWCDVETREAIGSAAVFRELQRRSAVYFIHKPYGFGAGGDNAHPLTLRTYTKWLSVLDADHIIQLPDPNRVVDIIFFILAKEVGRVDDFVTELEGRQTPEQVGVVYQSLTTHMGDRLGRLAGVAESESIMVDDLNRGDPSSPLL